jgi:monoamine oxidase
VLRDFHKLLPEFTAEPMEVHFYRRGHPLFLSLPGTFTKAIPAANKPLDRIFFANTDSVGPESDLPGAVEAAHRAAEWVEKKMSGATGAVAKPWAGIST